MTEGRPIEDWPKRFWKTGFDGRTFLTEEEWRTYLRRPPVRRGYIKFRKVHGDYGKKRCSVCGRPGTQYNPIQAAHRINALHGVRYLALTPDFLDDPTRLIWAHRRGCNKKVEWNFSKVIRHLCACGIRELPTFLPVEVRDAWRRVGSLPTG